MVQQGLSERMVNGRRQVFRFESPQQTQPAKLADGLRNLGEYWHEWKHGIGGNQPARNFMDGNTKQLAANDRNRFSRRKPIYQLLELLVTHKKLVPAAAFKLVKDHWPKTTMTDLADEITRKALDGTLPVAMREPNFKWELTRKKKRGKNRFRGTANTAVFVGHDGFQ